MAVPAATPAPESAVPTKSALEATADTVSRAPAMSPVTLAPSAAGAAERPWGQKKPTGHALAVPAAWPARQKKPAGQGTCVVLGVVADGQKKPAAHGFAAPEALPAARQLPAPHAAHAANVVAPMPPAENRPAGHAYEAVSPVPAGQNWPAGQAACCAPPENDVQM